LVPVLLVLLVGLNTLRITLAISVKLSTQFKVPTLFVRMVRNIIQRQGFVRVLRRRLFVLKTLQRNR
ncbi:hypothetical protein CGJ44_25640, partial [Vibrio parahaemolyticus]